MAKNKPAPLGNKYATKLKRPDYRQEAYKQYCAHLATGKDKKSFVFHHTDDPLLSVTYKTMDRYIEENPAEFPPILLEIAQSKSFEHFEEEGKKLMRGAYKHGSPVVWQTFMRNKFGYDKDMIENVTKCAADKILEEIRNKSSEKQEHYKKSPSRK